MLFGRTVKTEGKLDQLSKIEAKEVKGKHMETEGYNVYLHFKDRERILFRAGVTGELSRDLDKLNRFCFN